LNSSIKIAKARPGRDVATLTVLAVAVAVVCFSVHVVLLMAAGTAMLSMTLPMPK
jgi:hypothetical protein